MASGFSIRVDLNSLHQLLRSSADSVEQGAKAGLEDIRDEWVADAVDIAPLDKGALRAAIDGQVDGLTVTVMGNALQGDFNYGYYIHELNAGGKSLKHPGTEKKFLDNSFDEKKFEKILEDEIQRRLKGAGW